MRLAAKVDLPATLQGGQAFRWRLHEGAYVSTVGPRVVQLRPLPGGRVEADAWPTAPPGSFRALLRLERDDDARRRRLARDPVVGPLLRRYPGLRLLRQDPWETTVAFITSANNNVPRIEGALQAMTARWGDPIASPVGERAAFPTPARLARASEDALRACGLGYRAPYLRATARLVAQGNVDLEGLRGAPLAEVRERLLALPGVGPKVADCIALFSLDADDAFPLDRWMLRALADRFFDGAPLRPQDAHAFAAARWGDAAGLAQQFLFHAARMDANAPGTRRLAAAPESKGP